MLVHSTPPRYERTLAPPSRVLYSKESAGGVVFRTVPTVVVRSVAAAAAVVSAVSVWGKKGQVRKEAHAASAW